MTNTELLENIIKNSGRSKKWLAEKMGITYFGLRKKIENLTEFKASEIKQLCDLLNITSLEEREAIFFDENVGK